MKVALIHYWFITRRGGEKVVESILKLFPQADIYTLFYDKKQYGNYLQGHSVYSSKFDIPLFRNNHQKLFPLYPLAIKSIKLKNTYDLIISSESGPAKGINNTNNIPHICYIHTPMRYCWSHFDLYLNSVNPIFRPLASFFLNRLRKWDLKTVSNVDLYIANSKNIANRVAKYYNRKAEVVYPPIAEDLFLTMPEQPEKKEYYLSFGAITPYKKIDLLIETFNTNGKRLLIIGDGTEKRILLKKAKSNIIFKGQLEQSELKKAILSSKALLFPGEEDFGMIPLEVMSYGIPVIAYGKGGALETVVENRLEPEKSSGLFFDNQNAKSLQNAIDFFESIEYDFNANWIRNYSKNFREKIFLEGFSQQVRKFLNEKQVEK